MSYTLVSYFGVKNEFLEEILHFTLITAENNRFGSFLHAQYNVIFDMLWFISRKLFTLLFYREVSSESKLICGLFAYVKS